MVTTMVSHHAEFSITERGRMNGPVALLGNPHAYKAYVHSGWKRDAMTFDFDSAKAASNLAKHGISFEEAQEVFNYEYFEEEDTGNYGERRYRVVGWSEVRVPWFLWLFTRHAVKSSASSVPEKLPKTKRGSFMKPTKEELKRAIDNAPEADEIDFSDIPEITDWTNFRLVRPQQKERITIRLDKDLLEWFKAQEGAYQTRINAVLRTYMEAHS